MRRANEVVRRAKTPPHIYLSLLPHRLLHTDHRHHLKNNLMHGCSPPFSLSSCPSLCGIPFIFLSRNVPSRLLKGEAGGWGGGEMAAEGVMKERN